MLNTILCLMFSRVTAVFAISRSRMNPHMSTTSTHSAARSLREGWVTCPRGDLMLTNVRLPGKAWVLHSVLVCSCHPWVPGHHNDCVQTSFCPYSTEAWLGCMGTRIVKAGRGEPVPQVPFRAKNQVPSSVGVPTLPQLERPKIPQWGVGLAHFGSFRCLT